MAKEYTFEGTRWAFVEYDRCAQEYNIVCGGVNKPYEKFEIILNLSIGYMRFHGNISELYQYARDLSIDHKDVPFHWDVVSRSTVIDMSDCM